MQAAAPASESAWEGAAEDDALELKIRLFAVPAALLLAFVAMQSGFVASFARIFLTMWVHELGHAVTAWLCGLFAVPGPWRTMVEESRSFLVVLLVTMGLGAICFHAWRHERRAVMALAATLFVTQMWFTLGLSPKTAQMLVTFGGDAGLFVLGTLLMATMYAGRDTQLHKGWLRWGFLVIGAFAFVDGFQTWWAASRDFAQIPFGRIEGTGLSDATRLVDRFGWNEGDLARRYLRLAAVCGVVLAMVWARGVRDAVRRKPNPSRLEGI